MPYIINEFRVSHGRDEQGRDYTLSELYLPGIPGRFSFVLADCERPYGVKIDKQTCIAKGKYKVGKRFSHTRQRYVLVLYSYIANRRIYVCAQGGIKFTYIQPHGGNDVDDTDGCPIISEHAERPGEVYGNRSQDLENIVFPILESGEEVWWLIS